VEISVIIPAFNEEARLQPYLERVLGYLKSIAVSHEVIVVDDGSTDKTYEIVLSLKAANPHLDLIRLPGNRGKGYAVRTGMLRAKGKLRLFADADGATPIEELAKLLEALGTGADIAVGSRAIKDKGRKVHTMMHRKVLGTIYNLIVRTLAVRGIHDTQCGFKLFRDTAANDVFPLQCIDGFGFDVEILFIAQRNGYRMKEVPVNWHDVKGTKVRIFSDSLRMFMDVIKVRTNFNKGKYVLHSGQG
jgi:dolichyl-phosphate beta-glucosyltransferase